MATIIEIQEDKMQHLSEYAEKVLKYGGKLMQCIEEMETKSKYNEYSGHERPKRRERDSWYDDERYNRYY